MLYLPDYPGLDQQLSSLAILPKYLWKLHTIESGENELWVEPALKRQPGVEYETRMCVKHYRRFTPNHYWPHPAVMERNIRQIKSLITTAACQQTSPVASHVNRKGYIA